jgi:hypothetical protein
MVNINCLTNEQFLKYISENYLFDKPKPGKILLKDIFQEKWNDFLHDNPDLNVRPVVLHEVNRMIGCKSLSNGYATYECTHCGKFLLVPFTCKSRFCPSCGIKYALDRADVISKKCFKVNHRHLVFTISDKLRDLFLNDRSLLNILFDAVASTINSWVYELNKSQNFQPGFVCSLHTFGRDLKWNPHIHVLFAEAILGNTIVYRPLNFLPFKMLRDRFQTTLLFMLEQILGKEKFRPLKNQIYREAKNGFYVYAKPDSCKDIKATVKYVIRYSGRPAIAESRITAFDGEYVTFFYDRHEDGKRITETIHVYEFFKRLIRHIPDRYFHTIRYYGFYQKQHKHSSKIFKLLNENQRKVKDIFKYWAHRISLYFKVDPLYCLNCNSFMELTSITIKGKTYFNTC